MRVNAVHCKILYYSTMFDFKCFIAKIFDRNDLAKFTFPGLLKSLRIV